MVDSISITGNKEIEPKSCKQTMLLIFSALSCLNQNLKWRTLKPSACHSSWTDGVIALGSWTGRVIALKTDQCYSPILQLSFIYKIAGKYIPKVWGHANPKTQSGEREREQECLCSWERGSLSPLAPLFMIFFLPLGMPYVNWTSQECCLLYLRSSLQSSDLPLTFLCSIFMSFSLSCLLATAILNFCFLF